ncbi:Endopolyphosphatase [Coemansia sp. RSA 2322]|nr:Endopolyphosphatase [Coemansia sp. RSA 2322]KAJ2474933.1 Endopolyphosphatase [Coemansia sp. RSA 2320]
MYWYRANAKVGGCRAEDSPGLAQLAWLRFQVNRARRRDRGLLILGHVAPSIDNYRPSCLRAYARTVGQAVPPPLTSTGSSPSVVPIIAQLFGHSNINSWAFIAPTTENDESAEDQRLWWERQVDDEEGRFGTLIRTLWTSNSTATSAILANLDDRDWESMEDDVADGHTTVPGDFVDNLLRDYEQILMQSPLPSHMGVTIISPSIVPKLLPAFRVFHYLNSPSPLWSHLPAGTLLDYDVYTANLYAHNAGAPRNVADFFQRLYRFSDAYAINDLSLESYVKWARKLLTSRALRKRFRALTFLDT